MKYIRQELVARDIEELAFECVEHPACGRNRKHQPLVARYTGIPGGSAAFFLDWMFFGLFNRWLAHDLDFLELQHLSSID